MENTSNQRTERVSTGFLEFMSSLSPAEQKELAAALREPNTFLAEDMDDVLAILQTLQK